MKSNEILTVGMAGGRALPRPTALGATLPRGSRLLTLHRGRVIAADTSVSPARLLAFPPDCTTAPVEVGRTDDPTVSKADTLGRLLILGGTAGVHCFRLDDSSGYQPLGDRLPHPAVTFRLVREPMPEVNAPTVIDLGDSTTAALVSRRMEASGSLRLNPSGGQGAATASMTDAVTGAMFSAVRRYVTARNLFWQPFFVRCALRLFDGSVAAQTAPVLMLPSMLPPLLGVEDASVDQEGCTLTATTRLDRIARCRLEMSVSPAFLDALSGAAGLVRSVEIAVTAPIHTFDQQTPVTGFEDAILTASGGLTGQRPGAGGAAADDPDSGEDVADGHYAPSAEAPSADARITRADLTGLKVWRIPPRDTADFTDDLTGRSVFYTIASIPVERFRESASVGGFFPVPIDDNALLTLETRPTLTDGYRPLDRYASPRALTVYNRRLNLIPGTVIHGAPPAAATFAAHHGSPRSTGFCRVRLEVTLRKNGRTLTVRRDCGDVMDPSTPWRWFYYPDRDAVAATVSMDTTPPRRLELTLTPHAGLDGAFFCDFAGRVAGEDTGAFSDAFGSGTAEAVEEAAPVLLTSDPDCPFLFRPQMMTSLPGSSAVALVPAMRPMSDGQFGSWPVYLFTSDAGIHVLDSDGTDGAWRSLRPLLAYNAFPGSVARASDGSVLFACREGVMSLTGSGVRRLDTGRVDSEPYVAGALPMLGRVVESAGFSCLPYASVYPLRDTLDGGTSLAFDSFEGLLLVYRPGESCYAHAFDTRSGEWTILPQGAPWRSTLDLPGFTLVLGSDGGLMRLRPTPGAVSLVVAEVGEAGALRRFPGLTVSGEGVCGGSVTLWGSRGYGRWFPVASVAGCRLPGVEGSLWRRYVSAVVTRASLLRLNFGR